MCQTLSTMNKYLNKTNLKNELNVIFFQNKLLIFQKTYSEYFAWIRKNIYMRRKAWRSYLFKFSLCTQVLNLRLIFPFGKKKILHVFSSGKYSQIYFYTISCFVKSCWTIYFETADWKNIEGWFIWTINSKLKKWFSINIYLTDYKKKVSWSIFKTMILSKISDLRNKYYIMLPSWLGI